MNAVSKGVSLGIYRADEERGREAAKGGSQPYVDLIGRKCVLVVPRLYPPLMLHVAYNRV